MKYSDNIRRIQSQLNKETTLVAVTKYSDEQTIKDLIACGVTDFGENKVQDMIEKAEHLRNASIRWHFIGRLQRNKVKKLLPYVSLIHSVDSIRLLEKISKEAALIDKVIPILFQFNLTNEEQKGGFKKESFFQEITTIQSFSNILPKGIMVMGSNTESDDIVRSCFREARILYQQLSETFPAFSELSMGMSQDFPIAVQEGATMVRVGRLLTQT